MHKFIFFHKPIKKKDQIEGYTYIDNSASSYDHRMYSEIAGFKILFDMVNELNSDGTAKFRDDEWLSLNHYRRMWGPDYLNRTYIPQPIVLPCPVAQQYAVYHNIEDLKLCGEALKEEFPHLVQHFEQVMNGNVFIPYNICILTVAQFRDYSNFLFKVLDNFHKKLGTETYEARLDYVKRYADKYTGEKKDNKPEYQARIESFLAERLSTAYWLLCAQRMPVFPAVITLTEKDQKI